MAKKIVCTRSVDVYVLANTQHYVPMKIMVVAGNLRDFIVIGIPQKNWIHITIHLLWDTLEINWSSALPKLGNTEVTLPTSVTIFLMDKYRVRYCMDASELFFNIMLCTCVMWQTLTNSML